MGTAITHCMHSLSRFHHYVDVPMSHISLSFLFLCLSPFGLPLHVTQLLSSTASSKASWMIWMARMLNESPEPCTFTHTHAVLQTGLFTGESQHFHTVSPFSRMCLDGSGWAAIHTHTHTRDCLVLKWKHALQCMSNKHVCDMVCVDLCAAGRRQICMCDKMC